MTSGSYQNNKGYKITYENEGVFLTVYKSDSIFSRVNESELLNYINRKKIRNYNANIISEVIKKREGKPVRIAEPQEEEPIDAGIEIIVSQDKMKAWVKLTPPEGNGKPATVESIVSALYSKGIVFGMIEKNIRELVDNPVYNQQILVAEGVPPENGKEGEVRFLIDIRKDRKPTVMEDGTVNYKDMNLIENITAGQKLAELIPPIPGKEGKNIVGTVLKPIEGKPAVLPKGRNVSISEDRQSLIADIDGQLLYADGKISVFATYEVMADVDNSTGNIKFIGNVVVRGNVLSGFEIEAGGNIEVNGVVEGAILKAGGNIILRRGMHGIEKGMLIAGGDIISKYIERAKAQAGGNIFAEAIMHSDIQCGNKLELGGRKGLLVGGSARVGNLIELKSLGSPMYTSTIVEVGVDPYIRERFKILKNELAEMEEAHLKASQAVALLNKLNEAGQLTQEKRELLAKSTRSKFYYQKRIKETNDEMAQIQQKIQSGINGRIKVYNSVYPGVKVSIGNSTIYIKEEVQYCTLYSDGGDIRFGSL